MCGILGIVRLEGPAPELTPGREALAHRGPDDAGEWRDASGCVALAHRRLSIVDLSADGHQPFVKDGLALVYNGEVYNHRELRNELEQRGHRFRSRCDTEVVLEAYRAFGLGFVERLRGMFALGLWDEQRRALVLARDRIGVKPLFVYRDAAQIAFASELKALERVPDLKLELDESAAYDFLSYLYVPAPKSIYRNVSKLLPAHVANVRFGPDGICFDARRYWTVDLASRTGPSSIAAARDAVAAALADAVESHLVADVPIGCLLSGGVDSSTVAALAARRLDRPLRSFAIGFDVERHSETAHARAVAAALGTDHTERIVGVEQAKLTFQRMGQLYDEPFGDLSAIPTLEVCRVAREAVTVALSGDGGDEVFGGYTSYQRHLRRARWYSWVPALVRRRAPSLLARTMLMKLRGGPTLVDGLRDPLERHLVIQGGLTRADKARVLPPTLVKRFRDYDDLWALRAHDRPDLDPLTRFQIIDLFTYLPDCILVKVDRASMACSLEVRPPLLDHRLIEIVSAVPPELRNPRGALKGLLKDVVRSWLPPNIADRPKKGFGVPLGVWIDELAPLRGGAAREVGEVGGTLLTTLRTWADEHDGPSWARALAT